jgi:hypothetical protein
MQSGKTRLLFVWVGPDLPAQALNYFAAGDSFRVRRVALDDIPGTVRKHSRGTNMYIHAADIWVPYGRLFVT